MRIEALPMPLAPASVSDAAQIDKVARQMEGLFAQMMIKQMRQTTLGDSMFPGAASQFRDLHDQQIAQTLTQGKGLGLSDMIARQLTRDAGVGSASKPDVLPLTLAKAGAAPMLPLDAYLRPLAAKPLAASHWIAAAEVPRRLLTERSASVMPDVPAAKAATKPAAAGMSDALGTASAQRIDAFVARVWPHAVEVGRKLGVDPRAIVAQSALETGWGRSTISANGKTANNYFGIKATGAWRGERVSTQTQEFVDGGFRTEQATFRAYDGVAQSFADYAALLKRSPRYAAALGAGNDIRGFANALQRGGYATDPAYAQKIESIATGPTLENALARLDLDNASGPAARHTLFTASGGALGGF